MVSKMSPGTIAALFGGALAAVQGGADAVKNALMGDDAPKTTKTKPYKWGRRNLHPSHASSLKKLQRAHRAMNDGRGVE